MMRQIFLLFGFGDGEFYSVNGDGYGCGDNGEFRVNYDDETGNGYGSLDGNGFSQGEAEIFAHMLTSHTDCNATPELALQCGCMALGLIDKAIT